MVTTLNQFYSWYKYIICMLVLYIYIYSPALQIISFGLDKIVLVFAFLYLIFKGKLKAMIKCFRKEWKYLSFIAITSLLVTMFHREFKVEGILMHDLFLFSEVIVVPYAFYCLFTEKWQIRIDRILIDNAIIASLISIFLLANPAWADIMKNQILRIPELLLTNFNFRGFGFSDGLTFAYPVVQGFCAAFIVAGMIKKKSLYMYLALLPILASVFVNARSGLIPIFMAIILVILKSSLVSKIKVIASGIILVLFGFMVLTKAANSQLAESVEWGLSTFEIIGDMLAGRDAENIDALFHEMVQFPKSFLVWAVGTGYNIYSDHVIGYNNSDIGFCIRTVYGGIIYMLFWVGLWITIFKRSRRINYMLALIMFGSLVYLNWKGDFFVVNPSCRFFFLVYVFCVLDINFLSNKKIV